MNKLDVASFTVWILGVILVFVGAWLIYPPVGFIVLGLSLMVWSYFVSTFGVRADVP